MGASTSRTPATSASVGSPPTAPSPPWRATGRKGSVRTERSPPRRRCALLRVSPGAPAVSYFSDTGNNLVRQVTLAGALATVAGSSTGGGFSGDDGPATQAL